MLSDKKEKKKTGVILIHSHQKPVVVLAVVTFLFNNLRDKRSVPLTKESGIACFKNSCSTPVENTVLQYHGILVTSPIPLGTEKEVRLFKKRIK